MTGTVGLVRLALSALEAASQAREPKLKQDLLVLADDYLRRAQLRLASERSATAALILANEEGC